MAIIKHRRGTAAEWTAADPILSGAEIGVELDTGKFKIGNGTSKWSALSYYISLSGIAAAFQAKNTKLDVLQAFTPVDTSNLPAHPASSLPTSAAVRNFLIASYQTVVRWTGTAWETRPTWAPFGVVFLSTNDPSAPAPPNLNLLTGDVWRKHPDAV